jgi:hypothetical protein
MICFRSYDAATAAAPWSDSSRGDGADGGGVRDWAPPGWHWEVLASGTCTLVRNPGPVVDPDLLWWRSRGPQSFQREPAPQEVVAQRITEEDEHVRRYIYALDTISRGDGQL